MLGIKSKEKLESEIKVDEDLDVNLEVRFFFLNACLIVAVINYKFKLMSLNYYITMVKF